MAETDAAAWAHQIVDDMLELIDKAGVFRGRGPERMLELRPILNMKTGETQDTLIRLREYVEERLTAYGRECQAEAAERQ